MANFGISLSRQVRPTISLYNTGYYRPNCYEAGLDDPILWPDHETNHLKLGQLIHNVSHTAVYAMNYIWPLLKEPKILLQSKKAEFYQFRSEWRNLTQKAEGFRLKRKGWHLCNCFWQNGAETTAGSSPHRPFMHDITIWAFRPWYRDKNAAPINIAIYLYR